jgi:hypothetical protein
VPRVFYRTEIEEVMPLGQLRAGDDRLHRALEGQPSRFSRPRRRRARHTGGRPRDPAILDRRPKTSSKTGNRTGKAAAAAD